MVRPEPDRLLDAYAIRYLLGVPTSTLRTWAARGRLDRRGQDPAGRTLYRYGDVCDLLERAAAAARKQGA